jgi:hypothetical protein
LLQAAGFTVNLNNSQETAAQINTITNQKQFDVGCWGFSMADEAPEVIFSLAFNAAAAGNSMNHQITDIDAQSKIMREAKTDAEKQAALDKIQDIWRAQVPSVITGQRPNVSSGARRPWRHANVARRFSGTTSGWSECPKPSIHSFLPQMRMSMPDLVERARAAERSGFTGMALMDHFAPPLAESHDMWEAMTTAAWLLSATEQLKVSHLVLCDAFRTHRCSRDRPSLSITRPADDSSSASAGARCRQSSTGSVLHRVSRPSASLGSRNHSTSYARCGPARPSTTRASTTPSRAAQQFPKPLASLPIIIGGAGERTLQAVAQHADWWNLPIYALDKLDELRPLAGAARVSIQEMIGFVPTRTTGRRSRRWQRKRFGATGIGKTMTIGDAKELRSTSPHSRSAVSNGSTCGSSTSATRHTAAFGRDVIQA